MKGLRYLLEALAKLRTEREVSLVVIGREKEGGPSSRLLDELGLRDIVTFVTGVPEQRIIELYSEAEVAVVPSLYEGFSLPAIEAMSCGVPLVATSGGALPEVVGADNDTALVVPPGDSQALAAKIALALDDPALRDRIGAAGRQRVIDRWTWRHTANGTVEHYRALLAETAAIQARRPGGAKAAPRFHPDRAARIATTHADLLDLAGTAVRERADRCSPSTTTPSACVPGTCSSTSGCGFGRHAFEGFRRGARVIACDMAARRAARGAARCSTPWSTPARPPPTAWAPASTATPPACRSRTTRSTASSPARSWSTSPTTSPRSTS